MSTAPIKMLLIDDKMLTSELDKAGYRSMGISVKQVANFAETQEVFKKETVDLLVINMDYSKIDAPTICQHYKNSPETAALPIVLTSVQSSASVKNSALKAGADLFVEQPLPRQYFIEKLKKLLDQVTRDNNRIDLQEQATLIWEDQTFVLPIADISSSGILVSTHENIPGSELVRLSFCLPGNKTPLKIGGRVVRRIEPSDTATAPKKPSGLGIRFETFEGDSETRLEKYIASSSDHDKKLIYYL